MKKSTKIRLGFAAVAFLLVFSALPKPAQAVTCYRCAPDFEGGTYCKLSPHGMTECVDNGVACSLGGSTC